MRQTIGLMLSSQLEFPSSCKGMPYSNYRGTNKLSKEKDKDKDKDKDRQRQTKTDKDRDKGVQP